MATIAVADITTRAAYKKVAATLQDRLNCMMDPQRVQQAINEVIEWCDASQREVLRHGSPLSDVERFVAARVGIADIGRIRLLRTLEPPIAAPSVVRDTGMQLGFSVSRAHGFAFGYGLWLCSAHANSRILAHELRHIHQFEQFPSLRDFIDRYLSEFLAKGYANNVFEVDARSVELAAGEI